MSEARKLVQEAYTLRREGRAERSLQVYREAFIAFGDDCAGRAHCLRHIGDLALELGQSDDARNALREAEALYRSSVDDALSLANTVRLSALLDGDRAAWSEARALYQQAASLTGLDLGAALAECDRHLKTAR